jgi:hypothetical protein
MYAHSTTCAWHNSRASIRFFHFPPINIDSLYHLLNDLHSTRKSLKSLLTSLFRTFPLYYFTFYKFFSISAAMLFSGLYFLKINFSLFYNNLIPLHTYIDIHLYESQGEIVFADTFSGRNLDRQSCN